jgi:hypothetical protein
MSIRRMMLFTLGAKIKNLIEAFKTRVLNTQGQFEAESCLNTQLTQLDNQSLLDSASLVVTPNGYKENLLYSVVPNNTTGDMSVTRATTATRVNELGQIEVVPYNLFTRSEEFENSFWVKQRTSITQNTIMAPNGTMTADNLIATSGVTYAYIGPNGVNVVSNSFIARNVCTVSFYLKYNGLNRIRVMYGATSNMSGGFFVEVDLQLGIITNSALVTNPFIESVGDGWYRVGFSALITVSATNNRFGVGLGDSVKTVANGVDGVYIWGGQLVDGSSPRNYFQTTNGFNVPRIDYSNGSCPSILVEPQSTNQIRNNSMVGAVVGTPGTLPTNWNEQLNGLTREVVGLGVENGVNYIDFRFSGTASDIFARIGLEASTQIVAIPSQTWTISSYVKIISQPLPIPVANLTVLGRTSAGALVGGGGFGQAITPTTTLQRFAVTGTLSSNVTIARAQPFITFTTTTGQAYDFTVRVGMPQMEQQSVATSIIPTSLGIVTRNADVITNTNASTLIGQTEGSVYVEVDIKELGASRTIFQLGFDNNNRFGIQDLSSITRVLVLSTEFSATIFNFTRLSIGINKLCLVYTNGLWKVFRNGVLSAQQANGIYTSPLTTINVGAGGNILSPSGFLNGGIQELDRKSVV